MRRCARSPRAITANTRILVLRVYVYVEPQSFLYWDVPSVTCLWLHPQRFESWQQYAVESTSSNNMCAQYPQQCQPDCYLYYQSALAVDVTCLPGIFYQSPIRSRCRHLSSENVVRVMFECIAAELLVFGPMTLLYRHLPLCRWAARLTANGKNAWDSSGFELSAAPPARSKH